MVLRVPQQLAGQVLAVDGGRNAADAELPGGQDHVLRRPAQVPYDRVRRIVRRGVRHYQGHRGGRPGEVGGVRPDFGQLDQVSAIRADDEVPLLGVLGAAGSPAGVQDSVEMFGLQRLVRELPDRPYLVDRLPGVHRSLH